MPDESPELELDKATIDRRKFVAGAAATAGALAFPGQIFARVTRGSNSKAVAFAQPDTSFAGYPLLLHGAKAEASKRGYQLLESHANHQLDAQVNELNTWIGQGIGGVIVLPLDNNAMAPLIKKAVAAFGPSRCMWESDCPFQVQGAHTYQASVDLVLKRLDFLSADDKEWLLRKTAEQFFFTK